MYSATDQMFDWLPKVCAPKDYPISLIDGYLELKDGNQQFLMPESYIGSGWAYATSLAITGPDMKAVPVKLNIAWFAYRERKFYKGSIDLSGLNFDSLFQLPTISKLSDPDFQTVYIIIGLAPLGGVAIWLHGSFDRIEAGFFQAQETSVDLNSYLGAYKDIEEYAVTHLKHLPPSEQGVQDSNTSGIHRFGREYRKLYNWQPEILTSAHLQRLPVEFFNGSYISSYAWNTSGTPQQMPVPKEFWVHWNNAAGEKYAHALELDEQEVFAAFEQLGSAGAPLKFQIEINALTGTCRLYVTNARQFIELRKQKTNLYH